VQQTAMLNGQGQIQRLDETISTTRWFAEKPQSVGTNRLEPARDVPALGDDHRQDVIDVGACLEVGRAVVSSEPSYSGSLSVSVL
jgi:hypothetical protein